MKYSFQLVSFAELDFQIFLNSLRPEEVVLGVLANFRDIAPERALQQTIQRIEETAEGDFSLRKYFRQLRVLAQLRNLGNNLKDIAMDSIAKFVSIENDAAYMVGFDKGEEKGEAKVVASLLQKLNYSIEQIADIAGVSVDFVKNVKQKLSADK
ncbi:hypothetical protein [Spirosoma daeguense]